MSQRRRAVPIRQIACPKRMSDARRCADYEIVAEVMQETYLAIWRAATAFAGTAVGGSAVGWV